MNNHVLNLVNDLETVQMESQLSIYSAIGDQLVKEYYLEQAGIVIESDTMLGLKQDGSVPTLQKIANWFSRLIQKAMTYLTKRHIDKVIKKIRESERYQNNDEYDLLLIDNEWYQQNVVNVMNIHTTLSNAIIADKAQNDGVAKVITILGSAKFSSVVRTMHKLREDSQEAYDEVKSISSIGNTKEQTTRHMKNVSKATIDDLLEMIEKENETLTDRLKLMHDSINFVKETADYLSSENLNMKKNNDLKKEQYVKFITDAGKVALLLAMIQSKVVDRIRYSIGAVHAGGGNDV